ncbi:MAG: hypothetical protein AAB662_04810 [Patescibacteria group bacterium]
MDKSIVSEDILERLVFVKSLYNQAKGNLQAPYDIFQFSTGLILLHDAIDNLLGAIMTLKYIRHEGNKEIFLLSAYDKIEKKFKLEGSKSDIVKLNTLRNNIKHQGIFPNIQTTLRLIPKWLDFIDLNISKYFKLKIQNISLIGSIKEEDIKQELYECEKLIDEGKFKETLYNVGLVFFRRYESHLIDRARFIKAITQGKKIEEVAHEKYVFPKKDLNDLHLELLEIGMNPYVYHRFKNLVPEFGYESTENEKVIVKKSAYYWHPGNWTRENASFCLNWITDYIIKKRRSTYQGYTFYSAISDQFIEFLQQTNFYKSRNEESEIINVYKKGEKINAIVIDFVDNEWQDMGEEDYLRMVFVYSNKERIRGFLDKRNIKVTEIFDGFIKSGI